ncbi:MAG TPA: TonB-dependent receptor, partial [Xanthomonadales bacterium]|nr:TonB-dependent receptor [Xanthomonadales bacterium]
PDNYVLTPSERHALYSRVRYALTDTVDVSATTLFNERRSQIRFAPVPLTFGSLLFGPSAPEGFDVAATNVFNPFGVAIQRVQFRNAIAPRVFDENVDTLHVGVGVDGRGEAFGRPFAWSLHGSYADVEELETATGFLDRERVRLGVGPSFRAADGAPVCGTPAAPIAGCVPINVFGGPAGFTQAMYDYASVVQRSVRGTDQTTFAGAVRGDVLALPAGPLRVTAGYTHRRVSGFDAPDSLADDAGFAGGHDVGETYVALDAPLVADAPFAHALDLALAVRHVDYRLDAPAIAASDPRAPFALAGGRDDDVLGSVALRWAPVPALDVHAGYAESSRLPTLRETSSAGALGFTNEVDPCSAAIRGALSPAAQARCLQGFAGLPPVPALYESNSAQHPFATGGNPALRPEHGRTAHAALVWRPTGSPADALGVAWQRTRVDERIAFADEDELLGRCYVLGDAGACRFVRRDPSGQPFAFVGSVNAGRLDVETWDVFAQHAFATPLGAIDTRLDVTYLANYEIGVPPGADYLDPITGDTSRSDGLVGNYADGTPLHRVRANLAASWRRGDWAVHLGARYRSAVDEPCNLPPTVTGSGICDSAPSPARPLGEHHVGSTTYVDAQVDWASPWHATVSVGLRNALDRDPPVAYSIEGNFPRDAEVPGRFVYVSYSQSF